MTAGLSALSAQLHRMNEMEKRKEEELSVYCGNCGAKLPDGAAFCPDCGAKVVFPVEPAPEAAKAADQPPASQAASGETSSPPPSAATSPASAAPAAPVKKSGKLKGILGVVVAVVVIVFIVYGVTKHPASDLRNIVFSDYGSETFGEAVADNVRNVSWDTEKIDSTHYVVTMSGFIPDSYSNVELSFDLNYSDDYVYASAKEVVVDGDRYDDNFTIAIIMGEIYD